MTTHDEKRVPAEPQVPSRPVDGDRPEDTGPQRWYDDGPLPMGL